MKAKGQALGQPEVSHPIAPALDRLVSDQGQLADSDGLGAPLLILQAETIRKRTLLIESGRQPQFQRRCNTLPGHTYLRTDPPPQLLTTLAQGVRHVPKRFDPGS